MRCPVCGRKDDLARILQDPPHDQCRNCRSVVSESAFDPELYGPAYLEGHRQDPGVVATRVSRIAASLNGRGSAVLEIGFGDGQVLEGLRKLGGRNLRLEGAEINPACGCPAADAVHRQLRDAQGPYDVVALFDVLGHFRSPAAILAKARGLLVDGGTVIVSVPYLPHWDLEPERLAKWRYLAPGERFVLFTLTGLMGLLGASGFTELAHGFDEDEMFMPRMRERLARNRNMLTVSGRRA